MCLQTQIHMSENTVTVEPCSLDLVAQSMTYYHRKSDEGGEEQYQELIDVHIHRIGNSKW